MLSLLTAPPLPASAEETTTGDVTVCSLTVLVPAAAPQQELLNSIRDLDPEDRDPVLTLNINEVPLDHASEENSLFGTISTGDSGTFFISEIEPEGDNGPFAWTVSLEFYIVEGDDAICSDWVTMELVYSPSNQSVILYPTLVVGRQFALWGIPAEDLPGFATVDIIVQDPDVFLSELAYATRVDFSFLRGLEDDDDFPDMLNPLQLLLLGAALNPVNDVLDDFLDVEWFSDDSSENGGFLDELIFLAALTDALYNTLFSFTFGGEEVESALAETLQAIIGKGEGEGDGVEDVPSRQFVLQLNPNFQPQWDENEDPLLDIADVLLTDVGENKALRFVVAGVDDFSNPAVKINSRSSLAEMDNFIAIDGAALPPRDNQSRPAGLINPGGYFAFDTAPVAQLDRWEIILELSLSQIEDLGEDQRLKDFLADDDWKQLPGRDRLEIVLEWRAELAMNLLMLDLELDVLQSLPPGDEAYSAVLLLEELLYFCDTTCQGELDVLSEIADGKNRTEGDFIAARAVVGDAIVQNLTAVFDVDTFLNDVFVFEGESGGEYVGIASRLGLDLFELLSVAASLGEDFFDSGQDLIAEETYVEVEDLLDRLFGEESPAPLGMIFLDEDCGNAPETPCALTFTGLGGFAVEDISLSVTLPGASPTVATQVGDSFPGTFNEIDNIEFFGIFLLPFLAEPSSSTTSSIQWNLEPFIGRFFDRTLELFDLTTATAIRMVLPEPPALHITSVVIELDADQSQATHLRLDEAIDSVENFFDWLDDTSSNLGDGLGERLQAADEILNEHLRVTVDLVNEEGQKAEEKRLVWNLFGAYQEALESSPGSALDYLEAMITAAQDGDPQLFSVELFDAPDDNLPARLAIDMALPANQADAEVVVAIQLTPQIIIEPTTLKADVRTTGYLGDDISLSVRILEFASTSSVILGELEWSELDLRLAGEDALIVLEPLREALSASEALYDYLRKVATGPVDAPPPFFNESNLRWSDSVLNSFFSASEGATTWESNLEDLYRSLSDEKNDLTELLTLESFLPLFFLTQVADTGEDSPGASLRIVFVNRAQTDPSAPSVKMFIAGEETEIGNLAWPATTAQLTWVFNQIERMAETTVTPTIPEPFTDIVQGAILLGPGELQRLESDLLRAIEAGVKLFEFAGQDDVFPEDIDNAMPLFIEADAALANTLAVAYPSGEEFTLNLEAQARRLIEQLENPDPHFTGLMAGSLLVVNLEVFGQTFTLPNGDDVAAMLMFGITGVPSLETPTLSLTVGGQESEGVILFAGQQLPADNEVIFQTFTWLVTGLPSVTPPGIDQSGQNTTSRKKRLAGDLTEAVANILADTVPPLVTSSPLDPNTTQPASLRATCTPLTPAPGDQVRCAIHGGQPGTSFTIRAVANPVLSEKVVTFNLFGSAMFTFQIPETIDQDTVRLEVVGLDSIELSSVLSSLTINRELPLDSAEGETNITPVDDVAIGAAEPGSLWPMAIIALALLLFLSIIALFAQARHRRTRVSL